MEDLVILYPGVGSHHVGMGKYFYDNFKIARETFEEAGEVLKQDMVRLCFTGEKKDELETLENSQTALLTASMAAYRVYMAEVGVKPRYAAGHSLGEYSALSAAGAIGFPEALEIVRQRGMILKQAAAAMDGIMAWVINLEYKTVEKIIAESQNQGEKVYISAIDSPVQTSISGIKSAFMKLARKLEKEGAIVYPLRMSGPFHSPLMEEVVPRMKAVLRRYKFENARYPVIANQDARPYNGKDGMVENLALQLIRPIRWKDTIRGLEDQGITTAIEMGPDKVLKHLMKNNTAAITTYSMENGGDLEKIKNL